MQPDAASYAQGSKRPVKVTEKKKLMDAANKGKNPATQTKRVQSKRKLESITHQNNMKQIEEQEQLEGAAGRSSWKVESRWKITAKNNLIAFLCQLPCQILKAIPVKVKKKIKLKEIFNTTMSFHLTVAILLILWRTLCDTVRKYSCANCYSIFFFKF